MAFPVYTYYAFDLASGQVLTDVVMTGASPSWEVSGSGDLGGPFVPLHGLSRFQRIDVQDATIPYRRGLAVDRDGDIVWSGIITGRRYSSADQGYRLTCPGLAAYWQRRLITTNVQWTTPVDQFYMLAALMQTGGPPTVPLGFASLTSGVLRQRTIAASDLKTVLDEVNAIADNENGFEWVIESEWSDASGRSLIAHQMRVGSPTLLAPRGDTTLVLESPGNINSWEWDEDGSVFATDIWGTSTDDTGTSTTRNLTNGRLLAAGYPRVYLATTYSNITNVATLDAHIRQSAAQASVFGNNPTVVVRDIGDTAVGQWAIGDEARLRLTDTMRFPTPAGVLGPGMDTAMRITQASLSPDTGTISMTLTAPLPQDF